MRLILVFIFAFLSCALKAHDSTQINQSVRDFARMVKNNEQKAPQERNYLFFFSGIEVDKTNFLAKEYINGGQEMFVHNQDYNNSLQKIKDFNTYQSSKNRKKALYVFHGRYFLNYYGRDNTDSNTNTNTNTNTDTISSISVIEIEIKGNKEKNFYKALKKALKDKKLERKAVERNRNENELIKRIYNELKNQQVNTEEFIIAFIVEEYHAYYDELPLGKTIDDIEPKIEVISRAWYQYLDIRKTLTLNLGKLKINTPNFNFGIGESQTVPISSFNPERGASAVYSKALNELVSKVTEPSFQEQIFDYLTDLANFIQRWQHYTNTIKNLTKEDKIKKLINDKNLMLEILRNIDQKLKEMQVGSRHTGNLVIEGFGGNVKVVLKDGNTSLEIIPLSTTEKQLLDFLGFQNDKLERWYEAFVYLEGKYDEEIRRYNEDACRFCPPEKKVCKLACEEMEKLYQRAGANATAEAALKKLCRNLENFGNAKPHYYYKEKVADEETLHYISCFRLFSDTELAEFFKDITQQIIDNPNHLSNRVNNTDLKSDDKLIDCSVFEAWYIVYLAKGTLKYKTDFVLLKQVANMLYDGSLEKLGGLDGLVDIIKKNVSAPCHTCDSNKDYLEKMDKYLESVVYFANTFHNATNFRTVFSKGIVSENKGQRAGAIFMLKALNRDKSIRPTEFEKKYSGCEADAIVGSKIYEFKSWSPRGDEEEEDEEQKYDRSKSSFWNFERGYQSYGQFLCYLRNITTLDDLEYIFDKDNIEKNGENDAENYVKLRFQNLFKIKANDIFNANPTLFNNTTINIPNATVLQNLADQGLLIGHPVFNFITVR